MAQQAIQQFFDQAVMHHQAGRLGEAELFYRQILDQQAENVDALHLLGLIAHQTGRKDMAVDFIGRAVALRPGWPEAHYNLAVALRAAGRLDEAAAAYRQAIALKPKFPEAHFNLGLVLREKNRLDEAIAAFRQAITLKPNYAEVHCNLGVALKAKGQLDEAIAAYRQAIALKPNYPEAYNNLGNALIAKGHMDEAVVAYEKAIALWPDYPEAYFNLGIVLGEKDRLEETRATHLQSIAPTTDFAAARTYIGPDGRELLLLDAAIAAYQQAITLRPNYPEAYFNLGVVLAEKGYLDKAIDSYRQAIALRSNYSEAYNNLGVVLSNKGYYDEAMAVYRQAVACNPSFADAHWNLAVALLLTGDFSRGWEEYEWRWRCKDFPSPRRNFTQPQWDGSALEGQTILLHAEQGFGDTLQFIRYLPLIVQRGGRVIVECQPEVQRLLQYMDTNVSVVAKGQPLPNFDLHCPLLSLPKVMETRLATIPNAVPYLQANTEEIERWRQRLAPHAQSLKVGLVWGGHPKPNPHRSCGLQRLAPLANVKGVTLFSLQTGEHAREIEQAPQGLHLIDLTKEFQNFADTAAFLANLDLVITIDTAMAHLAGAMGIPVWTMLIFAADWRWLLQREDSPWYPTMRLFRQPSIGDWDSVSARVAQALESACCTS